MTAAEEPADPVPAACTDPGHTHRVPVWHGRLRTNIGATVVVTTLNPAVLVARLPRGWSVERWTW